MHNQICAICTIDKPVQEIDSGREKCYTMYVPTKGYEKNKTKKDEVNSMKTTASYNFTAKDTVKATADTESLKNVVGVQLTITGAALVDKADSEGNPTTIAYIKTDDGNMYGSNSRTVCDAISAVINYLTDTGEGATIAVMPKSRKSANKRDFITLDIV